MFKLLKENIRIAMGSIKTQLLRTILTVLIIAIGITALVCILTVVAALENNAFSDFEDGLQEECAVEAMADYIVTRNPADFKHSRVKVILPDELLRELEKN